MSFLNQIKHLPVFAFVAACATTGSSTRKGSYSYLASTRSVVADLTREEGLTASIADDTRSSVDRSKLVFGSLCSSPAVGKKMSVRVTLVIPQMPAGIPLQKAQELRHKVKQAASDSLLGFFRNDFSQTSKNYESRRALEARLAHLRDVSFKELVEDFKYNAPIFQTPVYFYMPKEDSFILTFSSSLYDASYDVLYSPILATNSDKTASYLFAPSGDSLSIESRRAYLWARPTSVTLQPEDGWPKASYRFENFDGSYHPTNWVESQKYVGQREQMHLRAYNPADLTEMRLLKDNYVVIPVGITDTSKLLAQKDRIWGEYIKRYTEISSSETGDPSLSNHVVTLDLSQMCARARSVTDLLSK